MPIATGPVNTSHRTSLESPPTLERHTAARLLVKMSPQEQPQWLFTEDELLLTPSIVDGGLPPAKERENRGKGVNFILQAGIMLRLPQNTVATASVFLHRFYMRHSMVDTKSRAPAYHYYSMAATCLFLATKVEENCRKMRELVVACVRVAQKDPNKIVDDNDREYWRWRDNILASEDLLLETLCFDLSLEPPNKTLLELLLHFHVENNKRLRNSAWAFVNDSCLTILCLLFPTRVIAASAFYAAAKYAGVAFPDDKDGRPWWTAIGVDIGEVRRACNIMADMYQNKPAKPDRDGFTYEKTPEITDLTDATRIPRASPDVSPEHMDIDHVGPEAENDEAGSLVSNNGQMSDHVGMNGDSSNGATDRRRHANSDGSEGRTDEAATQRSWTVNGAVHSQEHDFKSRSGRAQAANPDEEHLSEEGELES